MDAWLAVATGPTVRVDRLRLAGVRVWIERREQGNVYNLVLLPKKNAAQARAATAGGDAAAPGMAARTRSCTRPTTRRGAVSAVGRREAVAAAAGVHPRRARAGGRGRGADQAVPAQPRARR